jgi:hypothetical protein
MVCIPHVQEEETEELSANALNEAKRRESRDLAIEADKMHVYNKENRR